MAEEASDRPEEGGDSTSTPTPRRRMPQRTDEPEAEVLKAGGVEKIPSVESTLFLSLSPPLGGGVEVV